MKKRNIFKFLICAAFAVFFAAACAVPCAAVSAEAAADTIVLSDADNCDDWNQYKYYNVYDEYEIVKYGSSVRVDSMHTQIVFLVKFGSGVDISALSGGGSSLYFQMWVYVKDAYNFNRTNKAEIELSSNSNGESNSYFFNLLGYRYIQGWNLLTLGLSDAITLGAPPTFIRTMRFTTFIAGVKMSAYFARPVITSAPENPDASELGLIETKNAFIERDVSGFDEDARNRSVPVLVLLILGGTAVAAAGATAALVFIRRKKA